MNPPTFDANIHVLRYSSLRCTVFFGLATEDALSHFVLYLAEYLLTPDTSRVVDGLFLAFVVRSREERDVFLKFGEVLKEVRAVTVRSNLGDVLGYSVVGSAAERGDSPILSQHA